MLVCNRVKGGKGALCNSFRGLFATGDGHASPLAALIEPLRTVVSSASCSSAEPAVNLSTDTVELPRPAALGDIRSDWTSDPYSHEPVFRAIARLQTPLPSRWPDMQLAAVQERRNFRDI